MSGVCGSGVCVGGCIWGCVCVYVYISKECQPLGSQYCEGEGFCSALYRLRLNGDRVEGPVRELAAGWSLGNP